MHPETDIARDGTRIQAIEIFLAMHGAALSKLGSPFLMAPLALSVGHLLTTYTLSSEAQALHTSAQRALISQAACSKTIKMARRPTLSNRAFESGRNARQA